VAARPILAPMPAPPQLSILVISYRTRELTLACLESVRATAGDLELELIVVDNASDDGSAQAIGERFPEFTLLALDENLGFARANNLAAQHATAPTLLLLNPDTVVWEGCLQALLAFRVEHPEAGILGGRTFFPDGSLNPSSCWGKPSLWSVFCLALGLTSLFRRNALFAPENLGTWQRDSVRQVDLVSGCLLMIDRDLWEELRGFDESFFMYGEDTDLCLRVGALGKPCLITPDARITHYGGASERVRTDKMVRLFSARAALYAKHWSPLAARFGVWMLDGWALTRKLGLGVLARLQAKRRPGAAAWAEIWSRRAEWDPKKTRA